MSKTSHGKFFEDFRQGDFIRHAVPKTITQGDTALYTALYGTRFALNQSEEFARRAGFKQVPVDGLLVFHMVFGKTVADVSLNAIANLGYAECRFLKPVYGGDTLRAETEVIGLKENSDGKSGTVYVRTSGFNQNEEAVIEFVRFVMVRKGAHRELGRGAVVPVLKEQVESDQLCDLCPPIDGKAWSHELSGGAYRFGDYQVGEKINHVDGVTVEEAEHMLAARLYHNNAKVHFNALEEKSGRFGRRIVYGGHVMSIARALSFNGLANGFYLAAINGGRHVAPLFAGGTVYAWSEVKDKALFKNRDDVGALRVVTTATRDLSGEKFPSTPASENGPGVILELDYWVLVPV